VSTSKAERFQKREPVRHGSETSWRRPQPRTRPRVRCESIR
jgi:hypothetical protein